MPVHITAAEIKRNNRIGRPILYFSITPPLPEMILCAEAPEKAKPDSCTFYCVIN
jgi:hypothetical protein